jgi:hypothetical protein
VKLGPVEINGRLHVGTARVAVQSPIPHTARLPGFDDPQPVYLLDLEWVAEQGHRGSLVRHISERFGIAEVRNAQRWFD